MYKKSIVVVQWPKYIDNLHNFDKYGDKIVQIRYILRKKLSNAR